VSQRDNAVAEPSRSAGEQDAWEQDPGQPSAPADASAGDPEGPGASAGDAVNGLDSAADAGAASDAEPGAAARAEPEGSGPADGELDDDRDGRDDAAGREVADLELEGEIAADYVEGLLDVADLDGDIDMDVEGDRALVSVVGATLDELVGPRGEVLEALQELTRLAVHRQTGVRTRIMLDVGGYRLRRRAELAEAASQAADEVRKTGVPKKMWAMNRFERKIVHDAVAVAGLQSESEGEEPDRKVVVLPAE
jgi:spoIIIJ-associated protein